MKDSQQNFWHMLVVPKYIKANNERFSTHVIHGATPEISISRRIMKDSQRTCRSCKAGSKYIKANNERFSTAKKYLPNP